jgi:hypothetical protein
MAREQAKKLQESAAITAAAPQGGLPAAARLAGRNSLIVGPVRGLDRAQDQQTLQYLFSMNIPGYPIENIGSRFQFLQAVSDLRKKATPATPHPSTIIELPAEHKVLLAELSDLEFGWGPERDEVQRLVMRARLENQFQQQLSMTWFDPDNIHERLHYVPADNSDKKKKAQADPA